MGTITESISAKKYAVLLAKALPKVIESDEELERFAELLEGLDMLKRDLTAEEKALEAHRKTPARHGVSVPGSMAGSTLILVVSMIAIVSRQRRRPRPACYN